MLNSKQKKYIIQNRNKLSAKKISENLNIDLILVESLISSSNQNLSTGKKVLFSLILLSIPILFFLILEVGLRFFNYGYDLSTWIKASPKHYGLNFNFARRYFYNVESIPNSIQDVFRIEKQPNTFRVFVLGGSSAAGYPFMPIGSFSRYIRKSLEIQYPESNIEVVNLSLTAVNSYTILDIIPDVLNEQPDLILIYAGHNEYYGALGVGSLEYLGRNRFFIKTAVKLNSLRTFQLLRKAISATVKLFSANDTEPSGTLMSRMAEKKQIEYESDLFNEGIKQFEDNMQEIIGLIKEKNVPLIISTLASNIKDQKPFISIKYKDYPEAELVFKEAEQIFDSGDITTADSLFRFAKDLDMLRFRGTEKLNKKIIELAYKNNIFLINSDSALTSKSKYGIIGDDLMTDHLHPTIRGYQIIGKEFFVNMNKNNLIPTNSNKKYPLNILDSLTIREFNFSDLDSTIADYKLKLLKNDYPFIPSSQSKPISSIIKPANFVDSLALQFTLGKIEWERAQRKVAEYYLSKGKFDKFVNQMELLINQFPMIESYYNYAAKELIEKKQYDYAYNFLKGKIKLSPDPFSIKWLGTIELNRGNLIVAQKYLEQAIKLSPSDFQLYYNLGGIFVKYGNYPKALELVNQSLSLNPNNQSAKNLKAQLNAALNQ